jgi:hypothetical protein
MPANSFIERWRNSAAAERANYALFLSELCDYLEVPRPDPAVADDSQDQYVFERPVTFRYPTGLSSTGRIHLYKRGCFVLEAKQGSQAPEPSLLFEAPHRRGTAVRGTAGWDLAMLRARNQAEQYAKALPAADGWSPELPSEDILFRLVELNAARAADERSGLVRWLRPEFQKTTATQAGLGVEMEEEVHRPARAARLPWPPALPERVRAVRDYLMQAPAPVAPETVARSFIRARVPDVAAILDTLTALGQARKDDTGYRA